MSDLVLELEARSSLGKNASRRLRAAGKIPAVVYGSDQESRSVVADPKDVLRILESEAGQNTIFKVKIGSKSSDVLIRDFQLDPIKGDLRHVDFQRVAMNRVMTFEVPVELEGLAAGVKEGGILDVILRTVEVECLPGNVPDHLSLDVSEMEIGDSRRVADLSVDREGVEIISAPGLVVASVVAPKIEEEPVPEEELEEVEEPEVIGRGKAEEEEAEAEAGEEPSADEE